MIQLNKKLHFGISILLVYIAIGAFGLFGLSHMTEMPMSNCPYTVNSSSVCNNSFDHINNWRQFSNTTFPSLFFFAFLALGAFLLLFVNRNLLYQKQYFYKWKYFLYNKKLFISPNRIIKWLSLLENSPSFSFQA